MFDQILQKQSELKKIMPVNPEFKEWLDRSNLWNWIYSVYRVNGRQVAKDEVVATVSGELRDDVPLVNYAFADACRSVYYDMKGYLSMQADPDKKMLNRWAGMLLERIGETSSGVYRSNNPIIYEWELIPAHFNSLDDELDKLFKSVANQSERNPIDLAAYVHLELDRLYPYGVNTVLVASAAMVYYLLKMGLPIPELSANDVEYNKIAAAYFENNNTEDFTNMLLRSIYNRLDVIEGLAKQANERSEGEA